MSGTGHTVKSYEEEMQSLNDNLVMMGSLTENQMACLLYTSPSPRDLSTSRMPSSA